jgi:NADH-quinone oxidoreductase subunit G
LRKALFQRHPHLQRVDTIEKGDSATIGALAQRGAIALAHPFVSAISDFYLTNPIARASAVMAECSALAKSRLQQAAE